MLEGTKISWKTNPEYEDEEGNDYFDCPFCEGSGIICKGDTADFGDEHTPMIAQISPDVPCGICEGEGIIKEFSECHFYCIKAKIFEIIEETFGLKNIDSLPEKKFKQFYTKLESSIDLLRKIFVKS